MEKSKLNNKKMTYKTFKTFKGMSTKIIVSTGLTEKEAQAEVVKDKEINPKCIDYMLCYTKEN